MQTITTTTAASAMPAVRPTLVASTAPRLGHLLGFLFRFGLARCTILFTALALLTASGLRAQPAPPNAEDDNSGARLIHYPAHPTHPFSFQWWARGGH